ncbi:CoA-dependent acyltransferase [Aulographum hederae CBS 113979]|uniref:CoA-dependent acyltransferase n=1 Tax=Aulographum hederae CBS 113979 TaxID=1176131 RepID=A0A6G1H4F7_9PEZI|nr:CoA-dependent acyltransferase [Aulographum hederae CBS 113979]
MPPSPPLSNDKGDLPGLPVPSLDVTVSALSKSQRLVLSEDDYVKSKSAIDKFAEPDGIGHQLQARLLEYSKTTSNWLSDVWIDQQYLSLRIPLAPYTSYFGWHEIKGPLPTPSERAACICVAALKFQQEVENGTLENDLIRDAAADMNQYENMFNACRIPQRPKDRLVRFDAKTHRYIAVVRQGHFFRLNYESDGKRLDKSQFKAAIDSVLELKLDPTAEIGVLTSSDRDTWADARGKLTGSSAEMKKSIEDIESSCFVLCLDAEKPKTSEELAAQIWYGNSGTNRWFDKPVQFVVTDAGSSGYVGEHSAVDGGPGLRLNEFVQAYIHEESKKGESSTDGLEAYRKNVSSIPIAATEEISELVAGARSRFEAIINPEEILSVTFDSYGESAISAGKRSANTCVQLIMNLAAYRMYGELKPNYEPVSLASFADGRWTSCSMVIDPVLKFCQLADDPKASQAVRRDALDNAAFAHGKNVSIYANGQENVEGHLLALKQMLKDNEEVPEVFKDPMHLKSQAWFLSASYLPSNHEHHFGFWQVIEDGVGVGTMIRSDR